MRVEQFIPPHFSTATEQILDIDAFDAPGMEIRSGQTTMVSLNSSTTKKFQIQETAKLGVIDYLAFSNDFRLYSILGHQLPIEFEREFPRNAA